MLIDGLLLTFYEPAIFSVFNIILLKYKNANPFLSSAILAAVSNGSDTAFCIHTLLKRLDKTHTWTLPPYLITQPQLLCIHHCANPHNKYGYALMCISCYWKSLLGTYYVQTKNGSFNLCKSLP